MSLFQKMKKKFLQHSLPFFLSSYLNKKLYFLCLWTTVNKPSKFWLLYVPPSQV